MIDLPLDFELFWEQGYTLERMPTTEYVLDPRFEIIGVGLQTPDGGQHWLSGDANHVRSELLRLVPDWSAVRVVAHNARLEASVLEWRLQIKPAAYFCTMVGARPHVMPFTRSVGLDAVARYFDVGVKGDYVHKTKGMHRSNFTGPQLADYGAYCVNDAVLAGRVAGKLLAILPAEEQEIIDQTIKKFCRPRLLLSHDALTKRQEQITVDKEALARLLEERYGATIKTVRSRPQFAELLRKQGAEPPQKLNRKGEATWAFAKDDLGFMALEADPNPAVRELVRAKMALSSTIEEGRLKRLLRIYELTGGPLPIPLVYYGTHPGRLAGDDEINMQNFPRVEVKRGIQKGHLRYALVAPPGYQVVAADFSNIEARICATLAGDAELREDFRAGVDVYAKFASRAYGRPINKKDDPIERFVGKTCVLGLNYGMGAPKFHLKMNQEDVPMSQQEATRIVHMYRTSHAKIPLLWTKLQHLMSTHCLKKDSMYPSNVAGMIFAYQRIILPNGMPLMYPGLKLKPRGLEFDSRFAGVETGNSIWGGMALENVAQALARIIAARAELRIARAGLPAVHQVHDELIWVVPTSIVERVKAAIVTSMVEPVEWLPELPIAVEIKSGATYGDAK